MAQVCDHKPHECACSENMMTPVEFYEWLTAELATAERQPVRFEKGHRPRSMKPEQLNLAIAG